MHRLCLCLFWFLLDLHFIRHIMGWIAYEEKTNKIDVSIKFIYFFLESHALTQLVVSARNKLKIRQQK